jgi:hypothetical protein
MTIRSIILRLILTIPALFPYSLHADAIPNPLFSDGAVLQRDQPIPIWGTAQDGEKVTVELNDQKQSTTATNGKWKVNFQPMQAGGPFTMTITSNQVVTLNNLLIGDVWLCSGQSNMHFQMKSVENAKQEIAGMNHPKVRFFTVKHQFGQQPTDQTFNRPQLLGRRLLLRNRAEPTPQYPHRPHHQLRRRHPHRILDAAGNPRQNRRIFGSHQKMERNLTDGIQTHRRGIQRLPTPARPRPPQCC